MLWNLNRLGIGVFILALMLAFGARAWTDPAQPAPAGNVPPPGGGGGSQTPWTSNINAAGFTLQGNSTASGNLTLDSTSDATKGFVLLNPTGGRVGILTATPGAYALDVSGDANATRLCIAGTCQASWPAGGSSQWTTLVNDIYYNTGNVGIGLTAAPGAKLHVASLNDAILLQPTTMGSPQVTRIKFNDPDAGTGPMSIEYYDNGVAALAITGGRVGIGTGATAPTQPLTVSSSGITRFAVKSTGAGTPFAIFATDPAPASYIYWKAGAPFVFATATDEAGTGWSEKLSITNGGELLVPNGDLGGGGGLRFKNAAGSANAAIYEANNNIFYIDGSGTASGITFRGAGGICFDGGGCITSWPSGGGVMTYLGGTTLGVAAASIDISLSQATEHTTCYLEAKGSSSTAIKNVRFNGDSGAASYSWNAFLIQSTAVTDAQDTSDDSIQLSGLDALADPFSSTLQITNFTDTRKAVTYDATSAPAIASYPRRYSGAGVWSNTAAQITSVSFFTSAGNFLAGSHAWCEGRDI